VTYHWTQTFPPGEVVKVKHEYHPVVGFEQSQPEPFEKDHPDAGMDQKTREYVQKRTAELLKAEPDQGGYFLATWVKYILTTANTWQGPIRDFELIVKKPGKNPENYITTFSWDGPVERIDATTFRARKTDFEPKQELTVYFLRLALATVPD
ncbi:MAG: DUF4424 family protein, partial [FCB group bacterium]|nr:DUF4424 family protein [FCB group bacterium]